MRIANLVTRSAVVIPADAKDVWPFVEEPNGWKLGLKPMHVSGECGAVGEVRRANFERDGLTGWLEVETVDLVVPHRKVVKIRTSAGSPTSWAAWSLTEGAEGTVVTYDVYGEVEISDGRADDYIRDNQRRFDEELQKLKALVAGRTA